MMAVVAVAAQILELRILQWYGKVTVVDVQKAKLETLIPVVVT